ncbi:MAG: carotenoid oxygenase family protein [Pseudomonadales bacterium]|jgi:carotenoid cleavage dioxygenase|nr:carotenoid oxygenase family protein [Pseudomonadales bacterium]
MNEKPNEGAGPAPSVNPYLEHNFAPVAEEVTTFDLPVVGELPPELAGRYLRNGPNPLGEVDGAHHHWFIGDGMVHGLRLRDGRAEWYRNRYVGSRHLSEQRGAADIPGRNWNDSATGPNTNVGGFAGRTWALVEGGGCPVELDYELETLGRNDFDGTLPGAFTAHPKLDPLTGELHAMVYAWPQWFDHVQYVVLGADGRVRRTLDVPLPGMTMMHDMSLTQRWVVIYDQPVTVDFTMLEDWPFPLRWNPDYGNRVGLLPREGRAEDIVWIDVPLGYCFHPMNAYDADDGTVVVDLCIYDRMFDRDRLGPFGDGMARLERWVLDPARRRVSTTVIDERANEFPRHRGSRGTLPYRYGYCASPSPDPSCGWPTLKHDLQTGTRQCFDHGEGRAGGEPVFVARESAVEEDDGYLLTLVHDLGRRATEFVVLDARDFARGYVARVPLPQRVPFGFHGNWVSDRAVPPG